MSGPDSGWHSTDPEKLLENVRAVCKKTEEAMQQQLDALAARVRELEAAIEKQGES